MGCTHCLSSVFTKRPNDSHGGSKPRTDYRGDSDKKSFPLRFAYNLDETKLKDDVFSPDKGIIGLVISKAQIYTSNTVSTDPYFNKENANFFDVDIKNVVCVPLVSDANVVGIIELMNKR